MFEDKDIGKLVMLHLDAKKHTLAKILQASEVKVYGRIRELHEYHLILEAMTPRYTPLTPGHSSEKTIIYDTIKSYSFKNAP